MLVPLSVTAIRSAAPLAEKRKDEILPAEAAMPVSSGSDGFREIISGSPFPTFEFSLGLPIQSSRLKRMRKFK